MIRNLDDLITPAYRGEQIILHAKPEGFGGKGFRWAETVLALVNAFGAGSVLDYGCGQGSLINTLRALQPLIDCREYDPGIPGKDRLPNDFVDIVVCTDVLEHIEPAKLANVINHVGSLARHAVFVAVNLTDTAKRLTDGRSAHLIVKNREWWEAKFDEHHWTLLVLPDLPLPPFKPGKLEKRLIAVYRPC
jgi:Methyltransferase domain